MKSGRIGRTLPSLFIAALLCVASLDAHEILKSVSRDDAVVVELSYPDGTPFSFEQYEIFRGSEEVPFQVGRTDDSGRIVFLPDRPGTWRIRAFSEDGHGVDLTYESVMSDGNPGESAVAPMSSFDRILRIVVGVFIIIGIFRGIGFFLGRRRSS